uniref:NAD(P)H-quinone oxidoreductase subunit 6, chloroplastic n=1 Tax=Lygodium microphyllum TaxID=148566 RepID=A0A345HHP3_9MONI|nr:NADH-plastoquinone oxidoreductase subunit 6 [Lygodium microphyllum]AXG76133.1 NADH-plastoquinone oxidoreductase subunit 6 [Lygodium microphyllum]
MSLSESIHEFIFILIELGIPSGSLGVVSFTNVIHSAFMSGLVLTCISLFYLILNADFVAAAQLLIYVGAINVLIVFAVMLTDKTVGSNSYPTKESGITLAACATLFVSPTLVIQNTEWSYASFSNDQSKIIEELAKKSDIKEIGYRLLTKFLVSFELLSIILLVASIGAITVAREEQTEVMNKGAVTPPPSSQHKSSSCRSMIIDSKFY